ncbi:MAG: hypothetical protein QNJ55_34965 [Xenococcus sp. MO_188.B8]|nr:hypothetical protein [Xenococcus sp. MO_188.B8]
MANYELIIQIEPQDVAEINKNGQRIAIVKEVSGGSNSKKVVWVSFEPFEYNEVKWEVDYGIYVSETEVQNGAKISKCSMVNPARTKLLYPCQYGTFGNPETSEGLKENTYSIMNKYERTLTFGVAQSVTANGNKYTANPLNAIGVLSQEKAVFTPIEKIKVFLHGDFNNGVIITEVTSQAHSVDLTKERIQTIKYDRLIGTFMDA